MNYLKNIKLRQYRIIGKTHLCIFFYKNPILTVPFVIPRHDLSVSFGSLIRKYRLENDLKDRTVPSQRLILILKEQLNIDPFELVQFGELSE